MCKTTSGVCPDSGLLSVSQGLMLRMTFPRRRVNGTPCSLFGQYWNISSDLSDNPIFGVSIFRFSRFKKNGSEG